MRSITERGEETGDRWTFSRMMASFSSPSIDGWSSVGPILSNVFSWALMKPELRDLWGGSESGLTLRRRSSTWGWSCRSSGQVLTWLTGSWRCPLGWVAGRPRHLFAKERGKKRFSCISLFGETNTDPDNLSEKKKILLAEAADSY